MIAALTLLPALLGFIGPKVLSRRQKRNLAANGPRVVGDGTKGFWPRWAAFIDARPVLPAVAALAIIVLVAMPFFSLRLGSSDQGNDPVGTTTRQAYDMLAAGFGPGFNGPLLLVASADGQANTEALDALSAAVARQPNVAHVTPPESMPAKDGRQVSLITVYPKSAPQDAATTDLIQHLRSETIPATVAGSGETVDVGGNTAIFVDFANVLTSKLPLFIGLVVLLSFVLLAIVFRSLLIPLTAAAMNLLSIGAAFGVLVAVFQWGWAGSVFEVNRAGPIEAFLPVMLFAILFGLSMDYEVFLITRIHEEWLISWGQPHRGAKRRRRHRQDDHRGRGDHDPRLRFVHPWGRAGHQGVRTRARGRHPDGRIDHPDGDRPLADVPLRQGQLVVPPLARPGPPPPVGRPGAPLPSDSKLPSSPPDGSAPVGVESGNGAAGGPVRTERPGNGPALGSGRPSPGAPAVGPSTSPGPWPGHPFRTVDVPWEGCFAGSDIDIHHVMYEPRQLVRPVVTANGPGGSFDSLTMCPPNKPS